MMNIPKEEKDVRNSIRRKIIILLLLISLSAQILVSIINGLSLNSMHNRTNEGLGDLRDGAVKDSTATVQELTKGQLQNLAIDKAQIIEYNLRLIKNQTKAVAYAATDIFEHPQRYIQGRSIDELPLGDYDFSCNYPAETLGKYSIQLRAPRELMKEDSIQTEDDVVVKAKFDPSALTTAQRRDFFLGTQVDRAISSIRNFDNGDGTYDLIGASYFALESSGIDILADLQTQKMIEYDARQSKWYTSARQLKKGEVYFTDPVQDASGRGISMICAIPVYAGNKLVGVAGSGGLMDKIRNVVQETKIGDSGYAFLINLENAEGRMNLITNADSARILRSTGIAMISSSLTMKN